MSENKGANVALKAGAWYVISSVMVKAVATITTPIFSRMMTTAEYGVTHTFTSWHTLLITFCTLNLTFSIGRAKLDYPDKLDDYIGSMQLLSLIVTSSLAAVALIFIGPVASMLELSEFAVVLLVLYLLFFPSITFFQNGFRYRYHYKENVAIAWFISLSSVILSLVLMLAFSNDKAHMRMLGVTAPIVVLSICFWVVSIKRKNIKANKEYWAYGLKLSLPLVLHTVSLNILAQSDRIFIAKICSDADVGIYSLVYNYGILISVVTNAVADGWLPWFHDKYFAKSFAEIRKNVKYVIVLGCYVGLACIAFAPEAVMILGGEKYMSGVYCVPPIVMGILCQYVYTHYVNIELHLKKTKYVSIGTVIAAVINIILNAIFIPQYGFVAAAYTTFFSYVCLLFIHFGITRAVLKVKLYNDFFMFLAVLITGAVAVPLIYTYSHNLLRYGIAAIGFISMLIVFRRFIVSYIQKLRSKGKKPANKTESEVPQ